MTWVKLVVCARLFLIREEWFGSLLVYYNLMMMKKLHLKVLDMDFANPFEYFTLWALNLLLIMSTVYVSLNKPPPGWSFVFNWLRIVVSVFWTWKQISVFQVFPQESLATDRTKCISNLMDFSKCKVLYTVNGSHFRVHCFVWLYDLSGKMWLRLWYRLWTGEILPLHTI